MHSDGEIVHIERAGIGDGDIAHSEAMHAYKKGHVDKAIAKFEKAIQANPDHGAAHNNLGLILYEQRKLAQSADHFDLASQLLPGDPTPLNNLGMTLEAGGRIYEAIPFYEQAHVLAPNHPLYLGNLVRAQIRLGEQDEILLEQLRHLAFIEDRPEWLKWVDEQLAIHLNPLLDRGPEGNNRHKSLDIPGRGESDQEDRYQSSESEYSDTENPLHFESLDWQQDELLPVPAPRLD